MAYYKIADLLVEMDTFGRTAAQAEAYRTEATGQPDISIYLDPEELKNDTLLFAREEQEYMYTGSLFCRELLQFDGMYLHASAVVKDGYAFLFSAPSGTGKSTHTQLWLKHFGEGQAQILNDDKPALRYIDGVWYAYGTPWSGKTDLNLNMRVPLGGIAVLERGQENKIRPLTGPQAVYALMSQTMRGGSAEMRSLMMERLDRLLTDVPVWQLSCTPEVEAAQVAYEAMYPAAKEMTEKSEKEKNNEN